MERLFKKLFVIYLTLTDVISLENTRFLGEGDYFSFFGEESPNKKCGCFFLNPLYWYSICESDYSILGWVLAWLIYSSLWRIPSSLKTRSVVWCVFKRIERDFLKVFPLFYVSSIDICRIYHLLDRINDNINKSILSKMALFRRANISKIV